jgi:hypothetical protein
MKRSSKGKGHQEVRTQASAGPQGEAVAAPAGDSPRLEDIRIRAYEIYLERGGQSGHDLDDWIQAERELESRVRSNS